MADQFIDKLAYIYNQDHKTLVTRTRSKDTYYIGGGKRELGETDHEALIREVREECSVELIPNTIKHYGTFTAQAHGKPEGTMVRMTCYTADFTGELKPDNEIDELAFFTYADINRTGPVDHLIFEDLHAKGLIS